MAIQSSGAISFNELKAEWNDSDPVSIDEFYANGTYVANNAATVPTSGQIDMNSFYGVGNQVFVYFPLTEDRINYVDVRGSNIFSSGRAGNNAFFTVFKYSLDGSVVWSKDFRPEASMSALRAMVKVDSSGNVYVLGGESSAGPYTFLTKFDSSGNFQWCRRLGFPASLIGDGMALDSSGNIYGLVSSNKSDNPGGSVAYSSVVFFKYNSSGSLLFQKYIGRSGVSHNFGSIYIDSSDNVFICVQSSTGADGGGIFKFDTNGNNAWVRHVTSASQNFLYNSIKASPSGSIYLYGSVSNTNVSDISPFLTLQGAGLIKLNSDGSSILAQKSYYNSSINQFVGPSFDIDSSENCYVGGQFGSFANNTGSLLGNQGLMKANSSLSLQWVKNFSYTGAYADRYEGNVKVSGNNIYHAGRLRNSANSERTSFIKRTGFGGEPTSSNVALSSKYTMAAVTNMLSSDTSFTITTPSFTITTATLSETSVASLNLSQTSNASISTIKSAH